MHQIDEQPPTAAAKPSVSWKEVTARQALAVRCHACGAAARQCCELRAGGVRKWPHRARLVLAANKLNGLH